MSQNNSEHSNKKYSQDSQETKNNKQRLLVAMAKHFGVVSPACEEAGVGRTTYYHYYKTDPEFKQAIDDMGELSLDLAEEKLHKAIKEDNITAIIFKLKTQGKKRGYIERFETVDKSKLEDHLESMTDEELLEMMEKEAREMRKAITNG